MASRARVRARSAWSAGSSAPAASRSSAVAVSAGALKSMGQGEGGAERVDEHDGGDQRQRPPAADGRACEPAAGQREQEPQDEEPRLEDHEVVERGQVLLPGRQVVLRPADRGLQARQVQALGGDPEQPVRDAHHRGRPHRSQHEQGRPTACPGPGEPVQVDGSARQQGRDDEVDRPQPGQAGRGCTAGITPGPAQRPVEVYRDARDGGQRGEVGDQRPRLGSSAIRRPYYRRRGCGIACCFHGPSHATKAWRGGASPESAVMVESGRRRGGSVE